MLAGVGAGGAKSRTQLTNMGKISANEDVKSSRELVRLRGEGGEEGIMTLTLHQGSVGEAKQGLLWLENSTEV